MDLRTYLTRKSMQSYLSGILKPQILSLLFFVGRPSFMCTQTSFVTRLAFVCTLPTRGVDTFQRFQGRGPAHTTGGTRPATTGRGPATLGRRDGLLGKVPPSRVTRILRPLVHRLGVLYDVRSCGGSPVRSATHFILRPLLQVFLRKRHLIQTVMSSFV